MSARPPVPDRPVVPDKTKADQRRAADPRAAAGVTANAGSGKTKVLVDRVLRLLLDGADPARILCLTFTRAAAATMQNRVFAALSAWVTLGEADLAAALETLTGTPPSRRHMRRARQLFARAVETPGGLRIETIHAFCERILHVFPFEANVPARFSVLDEPASQALKQAARREVFTAAMLGSDPVAAASLTRLARLTGGEDGLVDNLDAAIAYLRADGGLARPDLRDARLRSAARHLGLPSGADAESLTRAILDEGLLAGDWKPLADVLRASPNKTDQALAERLAAAAAASGPARLAAYRAAFLTAGGEGKAFSDKTFVTTKVADAVAQALREERDRVAGLVDHLRIALTHARTRDLFTLADRVLAAMTRAKRARAQMDFDDLIRRTASLLARADAAWVLYKLDAGIDHILVDEAQDNSPVQWAILERLVAEFVAGKGSREGRRPRTMFAVGDPKQSIYGFQGAAPALFEETLGRWKTACKAMGEGGPGETLAYHPVTLTLSFRSAPTVLGAVDAVFAQPEAAAGLTFAPGERPPPHQSAWPGLPGRVEVWDLIRPAARPDPDAWALPVDEPEATAPSVATAERVADVVQRLVTTGDGFSPPVPPGEILILARKRGPAFEATLRALKDRGVPVAGADRIELATHIAVEDAIAAARATLLPQDDLTLATALVSPLGPLDQDGLMALAAGREEEVSLLAAIEAAGAAGDPHAVACLARLAQWQAIAGEGPMRFFTRLLGPLGGRRALVSRLGPEAGDALDGLMQRVVTADRAEPASLAGFLARFGATSETLKRDMDGKAREVRLMTVHGAKGLEADVVILLDGSETPDGRHAPRLVPITVPEKGTTPLWFPRKADQPAALAPALADIAAAADGEHNRLLYVAMTRARRRLIVAPFMGGASKEPSSAAWHRRIRAGLDASDLPMRVETDPLGFAVSAWGEAEAGTRADIAPAPEPMALRPGWLDRACAPEPEPAPPVRPSGALGAAEQPNRPGDGPVALERRLRGTLVHALIEQLPAVPEIRRIDTARAYLAARGARLPVATRETLIADALAILGHPGLAPLFGPDGRAEVPVSGTIPLGPDGRPVAVSGQIDRLAWTRDAIHLIDMKTSSRPPAALDDAPESHVAQIAIYAALLSAMAPGKPVLAALVYTAGPTILPVPEPVWRKALARIEA